MHFLVIHKSYNHGCTLIVRPSTVQKKFKLVVPCGFDKERLNWSLHCIHGCILTTYSCLLKSHSRAPTWHTVNASFSGIFKTCSLNRISASSTASFTLLAILTNYTILLKLGQHMQKRREYKVQCAFD